jgi:hypothetical protein
MADVEYYPPCTIKFTRPQVEWLLRCLLQLRDGQYPTDPAGCIIEGFSPSRKAGFIVPAELYAELTARLDMCGRDGIMTLLFFILDMDCYQLGRAFGMPAEAIARRIESVLSYISSPMLVDKNGKRYRNGGRRDCTYTEWREHKARKNKVKEK